MYAWKFWILFLSKNFFLGPAHMLCPRGKIQIQIHKRSKSQKHMDLMSIFWTDFMDLEYKCRKICDSLSNSSIYFSLSYSWVIATEVFVNIHMDPFGYILQIFCLFWFWLFLLDKTYGQGPDYDISTQILNPPKIDGHWTSMSIDECYNKIR